MNDTELEGRLAAMLERRAAAITTIPPIRFGPSGEVRTRPGLALFAVAAAVAAVLIAVGGTVLGIRAVHHDATPPVGKHHTTVAPGPTPTPTPTATRACIRSMPQSWQQAITAGQIPLDHPGNNVISVNASTGEYLVDQVLPAAGGGSDQAVLAIFRGKTGQDIATMPAGEEALADGSAAITADWIAYGLYHPGGQNGYPTAMLYNRHTRQSIVLAGVGSAESADRGQLNGGPILFDGKAYWVEAVYGKPGGFVKTYDLASGARTSTSVNGAVDLVYYGTGLAVVTESDLGHRALVNYTGVALAPAAIQATGEAGYFTYDGSTLRWWNYTLDPFTTVLYANRPGTAQVTHQRVDGSNMTGVTTWPFVEVGMSDPASPLFDLRTNTLLAAPKGLNVQAVIGDQVLIGTGLTKLDNGGLSLVSLKDLPPAHC